MQLYVQFKLGSNISFIKLKENARIETCDAFMLLRIYFCDGCFIQMLKDLKNLFKIEFENFIYKKKKENFPSIPPFLRFGPLAFLFFFRWPSSFPRPSTAASSPAHLPSPARPSHALSPAQQPRAPRRPGNCRRALLLPLVADRTAPRISSAPFLRQPPAQAAAQPRPRRASWESSRCLGLVKRQPSPPRAPSCCPRSIFASSRPQLPHGGAPPTTDLAVRVAVVSEPSPPPIFARGELAVVPSLSPCVSFRVSWLIAPNPRAP